MKIFSTILASTAGLALAIGPAAPAAAQPVSYGGYNNGYNGNGGVVGAVINSVLGGGRYGAYGQGADRMAVDQCARAAEAQASRDYRNNGYGAYGQRRDNRNGYNQAAMVRVVGITNVERRANGVKVSGVMDSGRYNRVSYGNYGAPGYPQPAYGQPQYDQYGRPVYAQPGYGQQGYGQPGYANGAQVADLRFNCRVDRRGLVSNVNINRNNVARSGY